MAEGQDAGTTAEPSMEEILASIRKIISDDSVATPSVDGAASADAGNDDIIELTQMVQDDGSVVDVKAPILPEPKTTPAPTVSMPSAPPTPPAPVPPKPPVMQPLPEVVAEKASVLPEKNLVSETTVSNSASALSVLANTVEIERLSSAPHSGTSLGNGGRTLEDMVIELMRPLLKEWLEKNLPTTVDRLVQKEIERISRKAQS